MTIVSDSSPLISLARIGRLRLLNKLYPRVHISTEVYNEIVTKGSGLPGAYQVSRAEWIEVTEIRSSAATADGIKQTGFGAGEVSTAILAKEISAELILMDELRGRRFARASGFEVIGSIGVLEILYRRSEISDLRDAYAQLLANKIRIDLPTLQRSLDKLSIPRL